MAVAEYQIEISRALLLSHFDLLKIVWKHSNGFFVFINNSNLEESKGERDANFY